MKKIIAGLWILALIAPIWLTAQTADDSVPPPHIRLKAGIDTHRINLRWAVDEPLAWQKANKIGFTLKRYTLIRDGKLLPQAEEKDLGTFLPAPADAWKTMIDSNNNAAIVAQSLFGDSFEVEMGNQKPDAVEGIMNKSQELDQRFSFALMAADLDYTVACLAGWGYTDTAVQKGEKYLYVVALDSANNTNQLAVAKGQAMASLDDWEALPAPLGFIGIFQDKTVTLAWEYLQLRDFYTTYYIERSEDGKNFQPLSNLPVMNMNDKTDKPASGMLYVDSLMQNDKTYSYRLRGKTIFGEYGPYSNVVSGAGKKALEAAPRITAANIGKDGNIRLDWDFPQTAEKDLASFELIYSESDRDGSYKTLRDNIPVTDRTVTVSSQSPSNYFKIRAVGKDGASRESFAVLVQPDDNTPPAIPKELNGKIDSLGVVRLQWDADTDRDLAGYHVFRGVEKGEELVRLTPQAITVPQFTDTVQLQNLNSKVYYYVTAIDKRENQSNPSEILELTKPDIIKPEAPVFSGYKLGSDTIQLSWTKAYGDSIAIHRLYRQSLDDKDTAWKLIYEVKDVQPDYTYIDRNVTANHRYKYYLQAIKRNGLASDRSQEITLQCIDLRAASVISHLIGNADRSKRLIALSWTVKSGAAVSEIVVYRRKAGERAALWGTLNGAQNFLEDKEVQTGTTYTYLLKAMLKSDQPTKTETITVDY